ncbi:helix-turn-helix domain-containing protein [Halalkalicoccus subterraneus]|uniref:helix-turn-helix domain-containing protein n=1 Tax=Halalkalicoccus subterraneus TaxID=2675002 RepID=UPI000EFA9AF9|nr:helix-turn-helix domain-containing protein [Halalkalicoccus subterraneus]
MTVDEPDNALRLSLKIWHPDCWTTHVTEQIDIGILSYGIYTTVDDHATSLCTFYADDQTTIDEAIDFVRNSPPVCSVAEMSLDYDTGSVASPGNATQEVLVEQDGGTQITQAFTSRGFVFEPVHSTDGFEYWTLLTNHNKEQIRAVLDTIREEKNAEITVRKITSAASITDNSRLPLYELSQRQREVFELAREWGYYDWPKQCSARALATELGIATSTLHEHLHKVEAKLLDPPPK